MKHSLSTDEKDRLDQLITDAEKRTGAQIVLAVIERSDNYAELPWKAFALGASLACLPVFAINILWPIDSTATALMLLTVMVLCAGLGFALLSVFVPDFAWLFLQTHRAEVETRQYADSLFLSRELFTASNRRAVLIMVSLFERRIVILPDAGISSQLDEKAAHEIIQSMRGHLKEGRLSRSLEAGLQKVEELMASSASSRPAGKQLPNIIEEKGL